VSATGPCLQLDVGNSSAKWRLVAGDAVCSRGRYLGGDAASRGQLLEACERPDQIWVASVAGAEAEAELASLLRQRWGVEPWFARTTARSGDLVNSYTEPQRMGVDRWLAMLAARRRHPGRVCVVDAGSALTIDLVAADGRHEGGYIIPGAQLMERALLRDTGRVRFDEDVVFDLAPGTSTAAAVRHGVALAQAGAVALALQRAGAPRPHLLFAGGAGQVLRELLGQGGEYAPDLVFEGLEVAAGARQA